MVSAPKAFSLCKSFNIFCLDSELEISGSKIWFCFSVLSSELFLDSPIPVRDHPGQGLRATSLLKVPGDTSLANTATSHPDAHFPPRILWDRRAQHWVPTSINWTISSQTNLLLADSFALVWNGKGSLVSNHSRRVFADCLTDLRTTKALCFLAPNLHSSSSAGDALGSAPWHVQSLKWARNRE